MLTAGHHGLVCKIMICLRIKLMLMLKVNVDICKWLDSLVFSAATVHNLLFCAHTLCMNYVTNTFLLVSSSVRSKQLLCFVHGQGQKGEQKPKTKTFVGFHNHSALITMF